MLILKQRVCVVSIAIVALISAALPADGNGLDVVSVNNSSGGPALADFRTWDIYLPLGTGDWTSAESVLTLSSGSLYQDPQGGVIAPDPADFAAHPSLEFDTYVGIVDDTMTSIDGAATTLGGGPDTRFDTTWLDVRWSNTADESGLNQIPIMRVSLTNDAHGTWSIIAWRGEFPASRVMSIFDGSPSALIGDLNGDGFVGQDDLNILLVYWGQNVTPGLWLEGDPSYDGFVGQDDLGDVLGSWGQGTPPSIAALKPVPEPPSLTLAIGAIIILVFQLGRRLTGWRAIGILKQQSWVL